MSQITLDLDLADIGETTDALDATGATVLDSQICGGAIGYRIRFPNRDAATSYLDAIGYLDGTNDTVDAFIVV